MMTAKMGEKDSADDVRKAFAVFDPDEMGHFDFQKLNTVAKDLGDANHERECSNPWPVSLHRYVLSNVSTTWQGKI